MTKRIAIAAALLAAACATGPREIETRDVVVTKTERPITPAQVQALAPPAPMAARPPALSAALDLALAKLCEYVAWADRADPLLQHSAGMAPPGSRIQEPICQRAGR